MNETDIKIRGQWDDRYGAVATQGQTMDFGLTALREKAAALRVLKQASRRHSVPETSPLDSSDACDTTIMPPRGTTTDENRLACLCTWAMR
jgi:putative transposase